MRAKNVQAAGEVQRVVLSVRKKMLFMLLTLGILLGLMEIGLRLGWDRPPHVRTMDLRATGLIVPDAELGWRTRPNQFLRHQFPLGEAPVTIQTNSRGFRDVEHQAAPISGRSRVIVLGDSHAFGYGVSNGEIFTDYLQKQLAGVEIINLGITATNTAQQHKLLQREGLAYRPTIVVLAFCQNDIGWQVIPRSDHQGGHAAGRTWKGVLAEHFYLADLVRGRVNSSKTLTRILAKMGVTRAPAGYSELSDNLRPALKEYPVELQQMWDVTLMEIAALHRTAKNASARLLMVSIPARESVEPSAFHRALVGVDYEPEDFDLDKPYVELGAFARREGIDFISFAREFRSDQVTALYLPRGEIHLSALGHRRLSELLATRLATMLEGSAGDARIGTDLGGADPTQSASQVGS
jgi:lysophospholipase L1-like esterase